jgi:hypothetical protein
MKNRYHRRILDPTDVTVGNMTIAFDAPGGTATESGQPLGIARVERRVFATTSAAALDPDLRVYLGDLTRPYDLALREDLLSTGAGQSYGEMCEALIGTVVGADEPVDLLVLAFASPDLRPGRATASYLSHVCPGTPMAFAVTDQGAATAFSALRLIQQYARGGACRRALLLVAEQATLHYEPPAGPAPVLPDRHAAVAILLAAEDAGGGPRLGPVRVRAGVAPDEVAGLLADDLADGAALVTGDGLADRPTGQPFTGVWWDLGTAAGAVLLADYDRRLGYLATVPVDAR